jgi:hypothetical protein
MPMKSTSWLGVAASGAALSVLVYWSADLPHDQGVPAPAGMQRSHPATQANPPDELSAGHPFAPVAGEGRALYAELAILATAWRSGRDAQPATRSSTCSRDAIRRRQALGGR